MKTRCQQCELKQKCSEVLNITHNYSTPYNHGSDNWLTKRTHLILKASDLAPITLKYSPFKSREQLLYETARHYKANIDNEAVRHGTKYEPEAIENYKLLTGHDLIPTLNLCINPNFFEGKFGCTPDGITYCGILLETKCPYSRNVKPGSPIPNYYEGQVFSSMNALGLTKGHFFEWDVSKRISNLVEVTEQDSIKWLNTHKESLNDFVNEVKVLRGFFSNLESLPLVT